MTKCLTAISNNDSKFLMFDIDLINFDDWIFFNVFINNLEVVNFLKVSFSFGIFFEILAVWSFEIKIFFVDWLIGVFLCDVFVGARLSGFMVDLFDFFWQIIDVVGFVV